MPCVTLIVRAAPPPPPEYGTVTIEVVDARTGEPVFGARVTMGSYVSISNVNGIVIIRAREGKYSVRVVHGQYETEETTVTVPGTYTIQMEPLPPPPPETGILWGIAKEYRGGPASGVKVVIAGKTDTTGADGKYEIRDIPAGSYTMKYYYAEREYTDTVEITEGVRFRKDLFVYPAYQY